MQPAPDSGSHLTDDLSAHLQR